MHRATRALVVALASSACASRGVAPATPPGPSVDACANDPPVATLSASNAEPPWGARIIRIDIDGAAHVPVSLLRSALRTRVGDPLEEASVAADIGRLDALEVLDGIRVEAEPAPTGAALRFVVEERRRVASVTFQGAEPKSRTAWLTLAPGEIFDRARLSRSARGVQAHLFDSGHRQAKVAAMSHVLPNGEVAVCYRVSAGPRYLVGRIGFSGNRAVPSPELTALIDTHDGRVNQKGAPLREDLMQVDLMRVAALYYDRGYVAVHVDAPRVTLDARRAVANVEIPVDEGPEYRIGKLAFVGDRSIPHAKQLGLLGVASGEIFDRSKVAAGVARLEQEYRRRGRPMRVTPDSTLDAAAARIDLTFRLEREP